MVLGSAPGPFATTAGDIDGIGMDQSQVSKGYARASDFTHVLDAEGRLRQVCTRDDRVWEVQGGNRELRGGRGRFVKPDTGLFRSLEVCWGGIFDWLYT